MSKPARRVCSLLPSATEVVAALGEASRLVGRSAECDFPAAVRSLPVAAYARIDTEEASSCEIDAAVSAALAEGRSLYLIDADLIEQLAPDLILTQDLCQVCAVSSTDPSLCALEIETLALDAHTIGDIERSIFVVAEGLGVAEAAPRVAESMQAAISAVSAATSGLERRRVFVSEWLDPPFAAGHWLPQMVAAAGGVDVLGQAGQPSFRTSWEAVRAAEPEVVILAPCGFDAERARVEAASCNVPELGCPVVAVDANSYYSRPAPRIADGVRQLASVFHPQVVADPGLPRFLLSHSSRVTQEAGDVEPVMPVPSDRFL